MAQAKRLSTGVPEYNVLLLGESGAGKSTFINAFLLYLQNETWEEVLDHQLEVVIPIQFTVYDDNDKEIEVKEGDEDERECLKAGESGTMSCNSYLFRFDTYAIRLIDSPGMGSTVSESETNKIDASAESRAIDKKNVQCVLNFLSKFGQLHAIAVMVKANETRFTTRFNYCLKSVMSNLHKSAIDKLVFVVSFSNDKNFCIPKELRDVLRNIISCPNLNDDQLCSYDHKSFRYLLAIKHGAKYNDGTEAMMNKKFWEKSKNASKKFLEFVIRKENFSQQEAYKVQETFSINDARNYIEYIQPVIINIRQVHTKNKELMERSKQGFCLPDQIDMYRIFIYHSRVIKLDSPNVVCESKSCQDKNKSANDHLDENPPEEICCASCRPSTINFKRQLFCSSFDWISGKCKICGCHSNEHHRRYYKTIEVNASTDDFVTELKSAFSLQLKDMALDIKKMDNEIMIVEAAIKKFIDFLQTNPIFSEEVEHHSQEVVTSEDVYKIRDELFRLDIFGPEIKKAYEFADEGNKTEFQSYLNEEKVLTVVPNSKRIPNIGSTFKAQLVAK